MDLERLKTLSPEDRKMVLQSEAIHVEDGLYTRPLSPEELTVWKDKLASASVKQATILDDLALVKEDFKARLDPVKGEISEALTAVKFRAVQTKGLIYKMPDHEEQMIHVVDGAGNVISSRKMLPEERQFRINSMKEAI